MLLDGVGQQGCEVDPIVVVLGFGYSAGGQVDYPANWIEEVEHCYPVENFVYNNIFVVVALAQKANLGVVEATTNFHLEGEGYIFVAVAVYDGGYGCSVVALEGDAIFRAAEDSGARGATQHQQCNEQKFLHGLSLFYTTNRLLGASR